MIIPESVRNALVEHKRQLKEEIAEIDGVLVAGSIEEPQPPKLRLKTDRRKKRKYRKRKKQTGE